MRNKHLAGKEALRVSVFMPALDATALSRHAAYIGTQYDLSLVIQHDGVKRSPAAPPTVSVRSLCSPELNTRPMADRRPPCRPMSSDKRWSTSNWWALSPLGRWSAVLVTPRGAKVLAKCQRVRSLCS